MSLLPGRRPRAGLLRHVLRPRRLLPRRFFVGCSRPRSRSRLAARGFKSFDASKDCGPWGRRRRRRQVCCPLSRWRLLFPLSHRRRRMPSRGSAGNLCGMLDRGWALQHIFAPSSPFAFGLHRLPLLVALLDLDHVPRLHQKLVVCQPRARRRCLWPTVRHVAHGSLEPGTWRSGARANNRWCVIGGARPSGHVRGQTAR